MSIEDGRSHPPTSKYLSLAQRPALLSTIACCGVRCYCSWPPSGRKESKSERDEHKRHALLQARRKTFTFTVHALLQARRKTLTQQTRQRCIGTVSARSCERVAPPPLPLFPHRRAARGARVHMSRAHIITQTVNNAYLFLRCKHRTLREHRRPSLSRSQAQIMATCHTSVSHIRSYIRSLPLRSPVTAPLGRRHGRSIIRSSC